MVFNRCWKLQIENRSCCYLWERFSVVAYNWRKYIYYQNGLQKALSLTHYENGFFTSQNLGVAVGLKCCSVSHHISLSSENLNRQVWTIKQIRLLERQIRLTTHRELLIHIITWESNKRKTKWVQINFNQTYFFYKQF
jgi:hypothetical protein